ncbi:MAG: SUF system NifU family Fe-S cluster assembly protein [Candidatus Moranbacteria bacterium]|nr:SUF system NifU family Fe-S cluster assembly protein [Candidatus Moranbacteria bacterium]
MSSLYQAIILDHSKHPRNCGELEHANHHGEAKNPTCGDSLSMDVLTENGLISDIRFQGQGCAISQASASLLTESVKGKRIKAALGLGTDDILALLGVELSPNRLKCALLSLETLKKTLAQDSTDTV